MAVSRDVMMGGFDKQPFLKTLSLFDWVWAALVIGGAAFIFYRYGAVMDIYETIILAGVTPAIIAFGWNWKPARIYLLTVAVLSLLAVNIYGDNLAAAETNFFLKFLISSQSAIMWMSALFVMATVAYFAGLFLRSDFTTRVATAMTWSAAAMGLVGLFVRWRESYLIHVDVGHIPVSNLYEVFVLFSVITALLYLYYEARYKTRSLGAFVLLVITAAVGFVLWYTFGREAHAIQPLVPALKSYWMKIHVPANFIGYGSFSLAAMVGVAYLLRNRAERRNPQGLLATRLP
ncbi:MAG: cytochrome c biogenesis protein, partial [Gammaproteobacteria bacterium]